MKGFDVSTKGSSSLGISIGGFLRVVPFFILSLLYVDCSIFSCTPPGMIAYFYAIDLTESMKDAFIPQIEGADGIMRRLMDESNGETFSVCAVSGSQDKAIDPYGDPTDECYVPISLLDFSGAGVAAHDILSRASGGGDADDAQMTLINQFALAMFPGPWEKIMILFTDSRPHLTGPPGLNPPPQLPYVPCQNFEYPEMSLIESSMNDKNAKLIVMCKEEDVEYYAELFDGVSFPVYVSSMKHNVDASMEEVLRLVDAAVCPAPLSCDPEHTSLQVMHLQDVSSSFSNDIPSIRSVMPPLLAQLNLQYYSTEFGLASFSDKPYPNLGFPADFDYRLLTPLGSNLDYIEALRNLELASGRDWPEAQLTAMVKTLEDEAIGFSEGDSDPILQIRHFRVIVLATDAGFHVEGEGPPNDDYPSVAYLASLLEEKVVFPLFIVTSDVKERYDTLLEDLGVVGAVKTMLADSSDLAEAMAEGLQELCEVASRTAGVKR